MQRQQYARQADRLVLCTTERPEDDRLVELARAQGVSVYRGSCSDKLARWLGAAETYGIERIVTVDGDDPFCEPELVDRALQQLAQRPVDFIQCSDIACGAFTYAMQRQALQRACQIKDTDETEMMWVYFTQTGLFAVEELAEVPPAYRRADLRLRLDYPEDLTFFQQTLAQAHALG